MKERFVMDESLDAKILEEYRKTVQSVLARHDNQIVQNSHPKHAAIILEEMARAAKKTFYAFTRKLSSDVWNSQVLHAVEEAAQRGVDVRLVVSDCPNTNPGDHIPETLRPYVWRAPQDSDPYLFHFAEMDELAIRLEGDIRNRKAFFCANAPDAAQDIYALIRALTKRSTPCYL